MIAIGEETGALPELLDEAAVTTNVKSITRSESQPVDRTILIITVGGMVLILALGIFMPCGRSSARRGSDGAG